MTLSPLRRAILRELLSGGSTAAAMAVRLRRKGFSGPQVVGRQLGLMAVEGWVRKGPAKPAPLWSISDAGREALGDGRPRLPLAQPEADRGDA